MSLFDAYWTELLRELFPWASILFVAASFMGSETFFVTIIAIGYWTVDKKASKSAVLLLLTSSASNYWLKTIIKNPRPPSSNWLPSTVAPGYSLPSGHAQNSAAFWGWMGVRAKGSWRRMISVLIILLVSFSRIYIGVHWLGDILLGWFVGAAILGLYRVFEARILNAIEAESFNYGLILLGLISLVCSMFLLPTSVLDDNFGALGGMMIGVGVGFILEARYVKFETSEGSQFWMPLIRVVLGLCLVSLVMFGLSMYLVSEVLWLRAIRYTLVVVTVLFVWPYVFTRLKI